MAKKIRVLSCDGGGVRALVSVPVLAFIEAQMGKPLWQCFDYVCGVSTGAFQAAALTMPNAVPAARLGDLYTQYAASIFSRPWYASVTNPYGVDGPTYGAAGIEAALAATYGLHALGEAQTRTMIVGYDCDRNEGIYFQSFDPETSGYRLKDVLRASSAAPTYFPPAQIQGPQDARPRTFLDGGLVANNPALDCMVEACRIEGATVRDCAVLSVGTGLVERALKNIDMAGWGKLAWVTTVLDITMDGSSDLDDYRMQQLMPDAQYLRCQTNLTEALGQMDNTAAQNLSALTAEGSAMVNRLHDRLLAFCEQLSA